MTNDVPNISLAGHMLDKDTLLPVAWWLLLDVYWDDDREGKYRETCIERGDTWERNLVDRLVSPAVPDELGALMRLSHVCGRIEQSWGRSFFDVARDMYPAYHPGANTQTGMFTEKLQTLIYLTIMACIGHGIGPDDENGACNRPFPDELLTSPIQIENPMQNQLDLCRAADADADDPT